MKIASGLGKVLSISTTEVKINYRNYEYDAVYRAYMTWQKRGQIFSSDDVDWSHSHAQVPTARQIDADIYRIYFATRSEENMSKISYVDIDINEPHKPINIANEPVLDLGKLGTFDDSGVYPHWLVEYDSNIYLFYTGWMRGDRVPYYAGIGLAKMDEDSGDFTRVSRAPVLSRSDVDPYLMHSPCVLIENGVWRLWYSSATTWEIQEGDPKPHYHIRYAESDDGQNWTTNGTVCIDFEYDEWAIARPCVRKYDNMYEMWYCYSRGSQGYRIGYAESDDGITWTRRDETVTLEPSTDGWDSEMIGYPYVFDHDGRKYMLYNGSEFGKFGFGLAEKTD